MARTNGGADIEPEQSARSVGLRYVTDDEPGITRRRRGRGFQYVSLSGSAISDPEERSRIESLVIPPAWTDVWICRSRNGHIQATGRDARGRKQHLFQYSGDDGEPVEINSDDVNDYLRAAAGGDFTAKDFRTWTGTVLAASALDDAPGTKAGAKKQLVAAIDAVAQDLGNTPAVCRACYVHPDVIDAHLAGTLRVGLGRRLGRGVARGRHGLSPQEAAVLALLERRPARVKTAT